MDEILWHRLLREAHKRLFEGEDHRSIQSDFRQRLQIDDDTLEDLTTKPLDGCDCGFCNSSAASEATVLDNSKSNDAAPYLLEALRRLMRHSDKLGGGCSVSDDLRFARAAITKATGGAQ